ncbi:putative PWWP domain-containing protein [Helianthus annuus]|uniref:PWWP domain-containing protein n=1 Tax=Helianthus annuus TaxID=4232 RepID=A0A9K3ECR8_HELAN|nr:putative PWWP domain-containing protein [Helianthus annuus]KAJ0842640.1 putative PWWP domain-containing protein [Helianthus annuus]
MMEAETGGMVDSGVGTIVWVRRRNGSWWPGKILGSDELSASHLMSPRSGTPVKLLGREDASVDWYNLEKSKRVKPFRCGEFDDCIERAEASQGMPPKKREKYARREDAILHALELEKQLMEKKYGNNNNNNNLLMLKSTCDNLSLEEKKTNGLSFPAPAAAAADDNSPEVRPRLRGLQELGVAGPLPLNYKLSPLAAADSNGSHNHVAAAADEQQQQLQSGKEEQRDTATMVGNDIGDSFDYTHTLPDQVEPKFEKSPTGLSEENNTTGSNEDTETDSSGTESLMSDTYDASAALSDEGEEDIEFIPKSFGRSEGAMEHESMSDDDSEDSEDSLQLQTVSKWQLKGKRNSRKNTERKVLSSGAWMKEETYGIINWEDPEPESCFKGGGYYHHDPVYVSSSSSSRIKSMLIDVDVGVQSGYQREHVPMISLMSKLNDKAIVGHPIPVETLQDTSSDFILLSAADDESLAAAAAYDSTLQPWRTARRTAKCRVPRPPHLSTLEEDQDEYLVDEDGRGNRKSRKLLKKAHHRKTGTSSSNQKTRTLSSIGGTQQQQQQQPIMDLVCYEDEGMMKPEPLPTAVACIPVKLVFSRLHEELVARHQ